MLLLMLKGSHNAWKDIIGINSISSASLADLNVLNVMQHNALNVLTRALSNLILPKIFVYVQKAEMKMRMDNAFLQIL